MNHPHPKQPRRKSGKNAPATHADIERAVQAFKERGGFIKKLPNERVMTKQKVGVSFKWSSPYEDVIGVVDIPLFPFNG